MEGTVSGTSNSPTKLDRIASRRHVSPVEMALTMSMPLCLANDPLTASRYETELSVAVFLLKRTFLAAEYVVPSLVNGDAKGRKNNISAGEAVAPQGD
jgi:hypothetical protein